MSKFHPLSVAQVVAETRDAILVSFEVPAHLRDTFRYRPGQHLTLRTDIDGEDVRRSYSVCAAVQDEHLRIAIKRIHGGLFSNWANDHLKPGMRLDVMPPMGNFGAAHTPGAGRPSHHYLAFAAGSGITPVLSIIKTTLLSEPDSQFTLFYGNRSSSAVIFRGELGDLKDRFMERLNLVYVMSREQQEIDLLNGRLTQERCRKLLQGWVDLDRIDTAYICGPEGMMHAADAALQELGFPKARIRIELFATSIPRHDRVVHDKPAPGQESCEVTLIMDGRRQTFLMEKNVESVLDAGLRQGMDMRYSCKGGVCSTCRCKVIEGQVDMDVNYALEDYEIARGFVLSCQSYPASDTLTIDFDQDT